MKKRLRIFSGLLFWILIIPSLAWSSPFLVCNPYVPVSGESITDVEVYYKVPGAAEVMIVGTYTVSGSYIQLLDLGVTYLPVPYYYTIRWSTNNGVTWSNYATQPRFITIK